MLSFDGFYSKIQNISQIILQTTGIQKRNK